MEIDSTAKSKINGGVGVAMNRAVNERQRSVDRIDIIGNKLKVANYSLLAIRCSLLSNE